MKFMSSDTISTDRDQHSTPEWLDMTQLVQTRTVTFLCTLINKPYVFRHWYLLAMSMRLLMGIPAFR